MMDLRRFKEVNDTFGHLAGDRTLEQVARVLGEHVRGQDSVIRLGGDEFVVILLDCGEDIVRGRWRNCGKPWYRWRKRTSATPIQTSSTPLRSCCGSCWTMRTAGCTRRNVGRPESKTETSEEARANWRGPLLTDLLILQW